MKKRLIMVSLFSLWLVGIFANTAVATDYCYWTFDSVTTPLTVYAGASGEATVKISKTYSGSSTSGANGGQNVWAALVTVASDTSGITAEMTGMDANNSENTSTSVKDVAGWMWNTASTKENQSKEFTLKITADASVEDGKTAKVTVKMLPFNPGKSSTVGSEVSKTVAVNVKGAPKPYAPKFTNKSEAQAALSKLVKGTAIAETGIKLAVDAYPPITEWEVDTDTLAEYGLTGATAADGLTITGTPTALAKNVPFNVKATNDTGSATVSLKLNIGFNGTFAWDDTKSNLGIGGYKVGDDIATTASVTSSAMPLDKEGETEEEEYAEDAVRLVTNTGPVTWKIKGLPAGITATEGDHSLVLSGTFTTATELKAADTAKVPFTVEAKNTVLGKTITKDLSALIVYGQPEITTTSVAGLSTEKAYKQAFAASNYPSEWKVEVKAKGSEGDATDIVATAAGAVLKTAEETPTDAGTLTWNATKKQIEGTLTKMPAGGAVTVSVKVGNKAYPLADATASEFEIPVTGIVPTIANDGTLDIAAATGSVKFKVSKGTYPVTLKAVIVEDEAKKFDESLSELTLSGTADDNFKMTFAKTEAQAETGGARLDKDGEDTTTNTVTLSSASDTATLTVAAGAKYTSYKGLKVRIYANNDQTGTGDDNAVTKDFAINVNKDAALTLTGNQAAKTASGTGADAVNVGDVVEIGDDDASKAIEIKSAPSYNLYLDDSTIAPKVTFTVTGAYPYEITSPVTDAEDNGIKATVTQPTVDGGTVTPGTITFSGTPTAKKDIKFTLTAENPQTKKKVSQKLTFKVNYPKGQATEKPVIPSLSKTDFTAAEASATSEATMTFSKGLPYSSGYPKVYIEGAAAKEYGLGTGADVEITSTKNALGLSFAYTDPTDETTTGTGTLTYAFDAANTYNAYKGLPIVVQVANYVTGDTPVTKKFKINVNPNGALAWKQGSEEIAKDLVYPATGTTWTVGKTISSTEIPNLKPDGLTKWEVTSPADGTTVNGVTANVAEDGTVSFSGAVNKKGATKFTLTVENKAIKKKVTRKVTINAAEAAASGGGKVEKLAIAKASSAKLDLANIGTSNLSAAFEFKGDPTTATAKISSTAAKAALDIEEEITLGADAHEATGLSFTPTKKTADGSTYTGGTLTYTPSANVKASAYKGLSVTITIGRGTGDTAETLEKSFSISLNKDVVPTFNYDNDGAVGTAISGTSLTLVNKDGTDKLDAGKVPIEAGAAIESQQATGENAKELSTQLTYTMKLLQPFTVSPADTMDFNGMKVTTTEGDAQADGTKLVTVKITGTPTADSDTTSKIPLEINYPKSGKKAKLSVNISAFNVKPTFSNATELETGKEFTVGKAVSIKPKLEVSKKLTVKYKVTGDDDEDTLKALGLTLNEDTGEISGAASGVYPTIDSTTEEYVETTSVTLGAFINGNHPVEESGALPLDKDTNTGGETADASQKVTLKIKPIQPKIKTSKIVWYIDDTKHANDNAKAVLELQNIVASDLTATADGASKAKLDWDLSDLTEKTKLAIADDAEENAVKLTMDGSDVATSAKNVSATIKVSNYGIEAEKTVSVTIYDKAPAFSTPDEPTDVAITTSDEEDTVEDVALALDSTSYTSDATKLKWAIKKKPSFAGFSAKIEVNTTDPSKATLKLTGKKKSKGTGTGDVIITVTNSDSKEKVDSPAITVNFNKETTALPKEDSALPETEAEAVALGETTTALPSEELEAALPEDRLLGEGDVTLGHERTADSLRESEKAALSQAGYVIAAILPEITVTADGQYDLVVSLDEKVAAGKELVWFAFARDVEPSEDDEIVDFFDSTGAETEVVPENHEVIVSPWFDAEVVYAPVIAVKAEAGDKAVSEQALRDAANDEDKETAEVEVLEEEAE